MAGFFTSESTSRAHDSIDNILRANMEASHGERLKREGTIGPTPFMETEEGQQTLLDMVTGSPGGAIGRVAKGAVTGGHMSKNLLSKYFKKIIGAKPEISPKNLKGMQRLDYERLTKGAIEADNKTNATRILMEKALNKFGIKHGQAVNDPITEMLRASKYRRN
jgi:hypothetical protein